MDYSLPHRGVYAKTTVQSSTLLAVWMTAILDTYWEEQPLSLQIDLQVKDDSLHPQWIVVQL